MSTFPSIGPSGATASSPPSGWWRCSLGGIVIPGIARVRGGKIKIKLDPKSKAGVHGSSPTTHGLDPQEFSLEVVVWTDDDLARLDTACGQLLPGRVADTLLQSALVAPAGSLLSAAAATASSAQTKPVAIDHPQLRIIGISMVLILGAGALEDSSEIPRGKSITFQLLHYRPQQPNATRTVKGAPTRQADNVRKKASANARPDQQPDIAAPPAPLP